MYNLIRYYCSVSVSVFSLCFTSPFSIRSGISTASQGRYQMRRERRRGGSTRRRSGGRKERRKDRRCEQGGVMKKYEGEEEWKAVKCVYDNAQN